MCSGQDLRIHTNLDVSHVVRLSCSANLHSACRWSVSCISEVRRFGKRNKHRAGSSTFDSLSEPNELCKSRRPKEKSALIFNPCVLYRDDSVSRSWPLFVTQYAVSGGVEYHHLDFLVTM